MKTHEHELKCTPLYFHLVCSGRKRFEFRVNDRGFRAGDRLRLLEYDGVLYTGKWALVLVDFILSDVPGLGEHFVIMSITVQETGSYTPVP